MEVGVTLKLRQEIYFVLSNTVFSPSANVEPILKLQMIGKVETGLIIFFTQP